MSGLRNDALLASLKKKQKQRLPTAWEADNQGPTKTSQLHKSDSEQRVRMGCPPLITKEGLVGKGGGYRRKVSANSIDGS
jgi:hypothetical protein